MIKEAGIDFKRLPESKPDSPLANYSGAGVIFGVTGGVTEAVIRHVLADASPNTLQTASATPMSLTNVTSCSALSLSV